MKDGPPLVSILTPTYNHEPYITSCMESVRAQTFSNWEQIILDDGSTDRTADIVQSFSDPRIRFFRQANRGIEALAHTYNDALSRAQGEIMALLEGDDSWPREKLSALIPKFSDAGVVLAYGAARDCDSAGRVNRQLSRSVRHRRDLPASILFNIPVGSATRYMLRADGLDLIPECTVLIRRSALEAIGGFQYVRGLCTTSFPTFLQLGLVGQFYYTPAVMGYRRRHASSASLRYFDRMMEGAERHALEFIDQHELQLTDGERTAFACSWRQAAYRRHFVVGRHLSTQRRWKEARKRFRRALNPLLPRTFFASVAGWILAGFHRDLESILGLLGKARLIVGHPLARSNSSADSGRTP
jgi:glycosyltransferase involved in cell wall biosynthesis